MMTKERSKRMDAAMGAAAYAVLMACVATVMIASIAPVA